MDNDDKAFYESYIANFNANEADREALRKALSTGNWGTADLVMLGAYGLWNDAIYKGSK
jgi:hypothetical protein